jgi:hypothetical protein
MARLPMPEMPVTAVPIPMVGSMHGPVLAMHVVMGIVVT